MDKVPPQPGVGKPTPPYLQFRVGSHTVRVSISPDPIREQGKAVATFHIRGSGQILISPDISPAKRARVLLTQLRECWAVVSERYGGEGNGPDGTDLYIERIALAFAEDLSRQGGVDVLERMTPPGKTPLPPPHVKRLEGAPAAGADRAMERWRQIGKVIEDPDFELTIETAAPLFATFAQLRNAGVKFDATLTALMKNLKRQGFESDGENDQEYRGDRNGYRYHTVTLSR